MEPIIDHIQIAVTFQVESRAEVDGKQEELKEIGDLEGIKYEIVCDKPDDA